MNRFDPLRMTALTGLLLLSGCGNGPVGETSNIEIRALNMDLGTLAQKRKCTFLDTYSILLGNNGRPLVFFYQPDGEHLSELGYLRWADSQLAPYLKAHHLGCVAMVGDSITRRVSAVKVDNGTREATWDDLLGIKVYNLGVDGETSADVVARLDSIIKPDAECYFLMIGNNDLHADLPASQVIANVETIIATLATRTGRPVVVQAVMPLLR